MTTSWCHVRLNRLAPVLVLLGLAGCSASSGNSGNGPPADAGKLRTLTGFYEGYLSEHRGLPPANEQALRDYLAKKQENLQKAGISVDEMFASPRGGKLQWVYGKKPPVLRKNNMTCYGYETEPVEGKRLIVGGRGMSVEVEESEFRAVFPK